MKGPPRRRTIQFKLNALVIGNILAVALGLMLISYYVFCQRVDEQAYKQIQHAAEACAENVYSDELLHFWEEINTEEYREVRERAQAAGDEEIIRDWMRSRPSLVTSEISESEYTVNGEPIWSLCDDFDIINGGLQTLKQYLHMDSVYYQIIVDGVTYNLMDPDEDLFYLGTVEAPIPDFADYPGNVQIPPIIYRSAFGWLCTAQEPIRDLETGEAVAVAGVDQDMTSIIQERYSFLRQSLAFVALLLVAAILSGVALLQRTAIRPLQRLAEAATNFAKEDQAFTKEDVIQLDLKSNDEISDLYREIQSMENRIVDYTEHLTQVTAEKERVNTELRTAANIQASMLPSVFPAFPDRSDFDLYASMTPAKEVGGDFYDFFLIDEDHLAVLIADVSDKGVPAALFMMSAKILINYRAQLGGSPSEILSAVNAQLCQNNKSRMFVTVWLGILDLNTGVLTCANAGHEYPVLRGPDGVFRLFKDKHGMVVGALARSRYQDYALKLQPGDAVFVYTDGVPEANNAAGEFYGLERMEAALNRLAACEPRQLLEGIRADVEAFTGDADQFDDLTMLCLSYKGKREQEN